MEGKHRGDKAFKLLPNQITVGGTGLAKCLYYFQEEALGRNFTLLLSKLLCSVTHLLLQTSGCRDCRALLAALGANSVLRVLQCAPRTTCAVTCWGNPT